MIEISNITKRFYALTAIDNVSLKVPPGEVLGLLGPNGAGKTTLLKLIAGILTPNDGHIKPLGRRWPEIGYKPERLLFPNHLRVSQYLEMVAGISNVQPANVKKVVSDSLARVGLLAVANKKIQECSKGMRQRLGLAQILIGNPSLLLLDEPTNGLDPEGQAEVNRYIQELHAAGKTILLSSHQLQEVTQVCTQLVILHQGKIHYRNSMREALAARPHTVIEVDHDLGMMANALKALHSDVHLNGNKLLLKEQAMSMRRQVLKMLLQANFDIVYLEQKGTTLAEIYSEAVQ